MLIGQYFVLLSLICIYGSAQVRFPHEGFPARGQQPRSQGIFVHVVCET